MIPLDKFKDYFERLSCHAEVRLLFGGDGVSREYMLIKYEGRVSFARCGYYGGSKEFEYESLDALFHSVTVDGICLERDWPVVTFIEADGHIRLLESGEVERW